MPTLADLEAKYFPGTLGVVPHSQDTEVIAHIDGVAYFTALEAAIRRTTGSGDVIYLVNWYFHWDMKLLDPAPPTIRDLLAQKIAAGVDVKIVLWTGRNQAPDKAVEFGDVGYWAQKFTDDFKRVVETNMDSAEALRDFERPPGTKPFAHRVLLDWSGDTMGSRHQKYAVVYNQGLQEMRAFVGGMDLGPNRRADPTHADDNHNWHDAAVELVGEAARGVWADFQIRWNETASLRPLGYRTSRKGITIFNPLIYPPIAGPGPTVTAPIMPPTTKSVRILRSYAENKDSWGSIPWNATPPAGGLQEVLAVYRKAINSAASYIYVEDQGLNNPRFHTGHTLLYPLIGNALSRGVKVLFVTSGETDYPYVADLFHELGVPPETANFIMCRVEGVYVHSKVVLIDDEFAAVGSANFWDRSMDGTDTELTAAIVDTGPWVRELRVKLMAEHFRVDANDATHRTILEDVDTAFGLFGMGTYPVGFTHPDSRLWRLRDVVPSVKL